MKHTINFIIRTTVIVIGAMLLAGVAVTTAAVGFLWLLEEALKLVGH